jgi:hypothetical protein
MRRVAPVHPNEQRTPRRRGCAETCRSFPMMDILMAALGIALFAAAIGYTYACERL